jgi:transposase
VEHKFANSSKHEHTHSYKKINFIETTVWRHPEKERKQKNTPARGINHPKRKPGGQPRHQGKTRSGFGRVDHYEILRPEDCVYCGQKAFAPVALKVEKHAVAQLVERPIEIVEYQRHTCVCESCGNLQASEWPQNVIPGQDLGISFQAFLGWANNYAHMPYEKQPSFALGTW